MCIKEMNDEMLQSADLDFSTSGVTGQEVQLNPKYNKITPENRQEYVRSAIKYRYDQYLYDYTYKHLYVIICDVEQNNNSLKPICLCLMFLPARR